MRQDLLHIALTTRGFMPKVEGIALHEAGVAAAEVGPLLEVGGYCGRSAVFLGAAAVEAGTILFSVDHHRGSEEHQPGQEYHDAALAGADGAVDTLPCFAETVARAQLEGVVIGVVDESSSMARRWKTMLGLVFLDGGHSAETAHADFEAWLPHLAPGGLLAIHDVFPDPAEGGRPPFDVYRKALESGEFEEVGAVETLRVLRFSPRPPGPPPAPRSSRL